MNKTIMVTGGAGYIGDCVVEHLLEMGCKVVVVDNLTYGGSYMRGVGNTNVSFVNVDICSDDFSFLFISYRPDVVVHLAAVVGDGACQINPDMTTNVNEDAVKNIADLCNMHNAKLIFASTCSVYGANNNLLNEESPTSPLSLYAGTKLNAEEYVKGVSDHIIFRLGTLFGISTEHARIRCDLVVNILTYKAMQGHKLTVFGGEQWRPLLHVRDAGRIFAEACLSDVTGTYILSHENYKIIDVAKQVVDTCSIFSDVKMEVTESKFEDLRNYKVDRSKLINKSPFRTELNLDMGIADMRDIVMVGRISDVWSPEFHNARYIKEYGYA